MIRWGVVGCGDIIRKRVAQAIIDHPQCVLRAACRRTESELRAFCHQFAVPEACARFEMLAEDPQLDAIYVATPVHLHASQTIAALEHGKHVLVEKPMAMTTRECDRMVAAAALHHRTLSVAYYRRFYPHVQRIQSALREKQLGTLLSLFARTGNGFPARDSDADAWRLRPDQGGGGPLMDIGSHRLDLFLALAGRPTRVLAHCTRADARYTVENSASVVLGWADGSQGLLHCCFGSHHVADELVVTGTRGCVRACPLNSGRLEWQTDDRTWEEHHSMPENLHAPLIADFVRSLNSDDPPTVTGQAGRDVNYVIELAYQSASA